MCACQRFIGSSPTNSFWIFINLMGYTELHQSSLCSSSPLLRAQVDLVGGYYDAGDNVKYGLPMAFTITTLAWTALAYESELSATGELENVYAAISWGTDYFLKASAKKNRLWVQVTIVTVQYQIPY